jgi:hypothetical protein
MTLEEITDKGLAKTAPFWTSSEKAFYRLEDLAKAAGVELTPEILQECGGELDWFSGHAGLWFAT